MEQNEESPRVETTFSIQRDKPTLTRSASTRGNYASGSQETKKEVDQNID